MPLSTFQPGHISHVAGQKVVLHCMMGKRSEQTGQQPLDAGFATVYNFRGGVQGWKDAGYATVQGTEPAASGGVPRPARPARQPVYIAAGAVVLLGTVLGAVASGWFLLLSGAVGVGLVYAVLKNSGG